MVAVASFWLLLCLPGYALLRRAAPRVFDGGLLSGIALSYLATFVLLSPISIAGYLFRLPVAVLAVAIVVFVLVAVVALIRSGIASWQRPKFSLLAVVVFAFIVCDLILGLRSGSRISSDATYHVARVHMLLANGFNSWDPYIVGGRFESIYHMNLYHALMAAACELTSHRPVEVWVFTLFWAKLAAAASTYHLAWVVLGERWLAWTAAATFTAWMAASSLLVYPNNITPYGILALGLAFAVEALEGKHGLLPAVGLAATAVILPQFHGLCYVFFMMVVGPVILGRFAYLCVRRLPGRREMLIGALALGVGTPWFAPQVWERVQAGRSAEVAVRATQEVSPRVTDNLPVDDVAPRERSLMFQGFLHLRRGRLMYDPAPLKNPRNETSQLLVALVVGILSRRRSQFFALAAMTGVVLAVLYVPPICTFVVHVAARGWIVARLNGVLSCLHFAVFPGAMLLFADWPFSWAERFSPRLRQLYTEGFRFVGLAAALGVAYHFGFYYDPVSREAYWDQARTSPVLREIENLGKMEILLAEAVPPGAILAASSASAYVLAMVCNCYPLALPANRGDYGVPDMLRRRRALEMLLVYLDADLVDRIRVARRFGVHHVFVPDTGKRFGQRLKGIYAPITSKFVERFGMAVITLDLDHPPRAVTP